MKSTLAIAALGLSLIASAASAAPQNGLYGGISYGSADYEVNDQAIYPDVKDGAIIAYLGQQLNNYFAAEIGLVSVTGIEEGGISRDVYGVEASVLGFLPITPKVSLFGRLGYWDWEAEEFGYTYAANTDLVYGAGVEYNPTPRLQMRLEAKQYELDGSNENINLVNGSVGYRF
ncbi:outer membrane beta-barrel protein [Leucothrix arctica]|uniref:Outer membrane protein beta-barrel domain-containing protein n=1 Tax=Leucothrix arctica TaxID=1481894 RepID=A0A317CGA7_9GAMM|nr:outer membrane beta-barrel protein [Leucothrix arctica]PWQ95340.1 hypothetical protein DKT75_13455 [Leucothrix arctica]